MIYDPRIVESTPGIYALKPKAHKHRGGGSLGYLLVMLGTSSHGRPVQEYAHRLVLMGIHGPPPDEGHKVAMHTCHNPACLNPHHLLWGSHKDNKLTGNAAQARYQELLQAQGRA